MEALGGELERAARGRRVAGDRLGAGLAWAATLGRRLPDPRLSLVIGDALEIEWGRLPAPTLAAGNLPYNVATAILERMLPHHGVVPRAAFLVQKEVADRLVARPGDPDYGSLSVLVDAYSEPRLLGRVRRGSFHPPPKVEGAFVGFELRAPPLPAAEMPALVAIDPVPPGRVGGVSSLRETEDAFELYLHSGATSESGESVLLNDLWKLTWPKR